MDLIFPSRDIAGRGHALTFDDVLIVPAKSEVRSRKTPDLSSRLTKNTTLSMPFISANMDTITESPMALAMAQEGGMGILHRFMPIEDQIKEVKKLKEAGVEKVAASIGVNQDFQDRTKSLVDAGVDILTIDIAHGHSVAMLETLKWVKDNFKVEVIAGNVATPNAVIDLIEAGADAIKVGIGPGSMCTTRVITGCGMPQLTAVALCADAARARNVPVIADGGIKSSGDIMKAFAAGAETVMLGSLLSGTLETPGRIRQGRKEYRGMASKAAQVSWRGEVPDGMAPEGEATYVPIKGHVSDVVRELSGGVRSGMSYINATQIDDIRHNAFFVEMSSAGNYESRAHGV